MGPGSVEGVLLAMGANVGELRDQVEDSFVGFIYGPRGFPCALVSIERSCLL